MVQGYPTQGCSRSGVGCSGCNQKEYLLLMVIGITDNKH